MKGSALLLMVAGGILLFVFSLILGIVIRGLLRATWGGQVTIGAEILPIVLGVIAGIIILHEAIHAVLFLAFGGRPRVGFKLLGRFFPVAYTTSTTLIPRNKYLMVCLGPLTTITLVSLVTAILVSSDGIAVLVLIAMAMNAAGSLGDIMAAHKVWRHDRRTLFEDREDGFAWYGLSSRGCQ